MWKYTGSEHPDFAIEPGPGQESVWDYPRPPILVSSDELVEVSSRENPIATSRRALRVLETASPPTYYLPEDDIDWSQLREIAHRSFCEWKGQASYFALADDPRGVPVAWLYARPSKSFAAIDRHASFYPSKVQCSVDGERVRPQPGEFYGGWITDRLVGPFKGEPGTGHW
ncbi:DUF427 domain-containing protein [Congregibacter litoralis]|uniref:DUF427 domain-containing protein n=1 Tax=Congregibacter litoralis KT71 TaxID=314285 RepID=A4A7D2_9GAMM|nr:DUF427 domain-containing protein [Congregibacter litoralis]EAQ98201.1 hypothetical protein KT71_03102 [Congregibacter litoralis KT71]